MSSAWPFPRRHELRGARRITLDAAPAPVAEIYRSDGLALSMLDQAGMLDEGASGERLTSWLTDYLYERTWMSVVADIIPDWGTDAGFDLPGLPGEVSEAVLSEAECRCRSGPA